MSSRICFTVLCVFSSSLALHIPAVHGRKNAFFQDVKYDSNNSVIHNHHQYSDQSGGDINNDFIRDPLKPEPLHAPKPPLPVFQQFNRDTDYTNFQRAKTENSQRPKKPLPNAQQSNGPTSKSRIFQRVKREPLQKPGSISQYSNEHDNDSILQRLARKQLQKPYIPQLVSRQTNAHTHNLILQRVKRGQYYKFYNPSGGVTQPQPFCTKFLCRRPSATKSMGRPSQVLCAPGSKFDKKANTCRKLI